MEKLSYSKTQLSWLVILRTLIGWHFLYEGIAKLLSPNWSSLGYLMDSKGILEGFFHSMASNPSVLSMVDIANTYGLIAIGLGLMLGVLTRIACLAGAVLLSLYFLSHPPLIGVEYALPSDGSYLWVNKTLIEMGALVVLYLFPTSRIIGIDRFIFGAKDIQ